MTDEVLRVSEAALALDASWDEDEASPDDRLAVGVAGLLLCALAGSLSSSENRTALRDELAGLAPYEPPNDEKDDA